MPKVAMIRHCDYPGCQAQDPQMWTKFILSRQLEPHGPYNTPHPGTLYYCTDCATRILKAMDIRIIRSEDVSQG